MTAIEEHADVVAPRRIYQNFAIDNTKWQYVSLRDDDILICTPMKSGTTWMQMIVALLVFQRIPLPAPLDSLSPWVERRAMEPEVLSALIQPQTHRRFLKSHMPFDGLPDVRAQKKIFVARNPRDMALSLWNHNRSFRPEIVEKMNGFPGRVGPPMPPTPESFPVFFREWLTRGWFDWESDGFPLISVFRSVETWWRQRDDPRLLLVHFNDLVRDLAGEMRRIADFLDIAVPEERWPALVQAATFSDMKRNAATLVPFMGSLLAGGATAFIHEGTNGRWATLLDEDDRALYGRVVAQRLAPDVAAWLETGGHT